MTVSKMAGRGTPARRGAALVGVIVVQPGLGLGLQLAAKAIAQQLRRTSFGAAWIRQLAHEPWAAAVLVLELASFALSMTLLRELKQSMAFPICALTYVLVILAAWTAFGEPLRPSQVLGGGVILAGVWLLSQATAESGRP